MYCTNSTYRINGRMTFEHCFYNLQATLSPPARANETSM